MYRDETGFLKCIRHVRIPPVQLDMRCDLGRAEREVVDAAVTLGQFSKEKLVTLGQNALKPGLYCLVERVQFRSRRTAAFRLTFICARQRPISPGQQGFKAWRHLHRWLHRLPPHPLTYCSTTFAPCRIRISSSCRFWYCLARDRIARCVSSMVAVSSSHAFLCKVIACSSAQRSL